jgi:hypothetical protein
MALIDDVKLALRINASTHNTEISDLIASATADMTLAGIKTTTVDSLIKRAITLYVKANFGYDNPDAERMNQAYLLLKTHLSLSEDYAL